MAENETRQGWHRSLPVTAGGGISARYPASAGSYSVVRRQMSVAAAVTPGGVPAPEDGLATAAYAAGMSTARRHPPGRRCLPAPSASPRPPHGRTRAALAAPRRDVAAAGTAIVLVAAYSEAHPPNRPVFHRPLPPAAHAGRRLPARRGGLARAGLAASFRCPCSASPPRRSSRSACSATSTARRCCCPRPPWDARRAGPIRRSVAWAVALTVVLLAATAANNPLGPPAAA